jgi:uncharacterized protein (DUF433 family)
VVQGQDPIIDRGRGPEIAGKGITVYRIMDNLRYTNDPAEIAAEIEVVTESQVRAALRWIVEHRAEVEAEYAKILEATTRPNAPWIDQNRSLTRDELRARLLERLTPPGTPDVDCPA